ncbi:MAG: FtsX-like permease family protein [Candidatus Nanopelagicales bacterium]
MWRVVLRGLTAHKRRLIGTCSAVILGVAFLAGTLVLSDTMRASFDGIFAAANAGTDAVVQGSEEVGAGVDSQPSLVPESLIPELEKVPEVASVEPTIQGVAQITGSDGKPVGGDGPPSFAGNWVLNTGLNPYKIVDGQAPTKANEVVINRGAAKAGDLTIGSTTTVRFPDPVKMTVVGIATFGSEDGIGGTTYAGLTFKDAQKYLGYPGKVNAITLQAKPGVSQDQLVAAVNPILPKGTEAVTGTQLTADQNEQINSGFLGFFKTFLLVFAVIALVVASFSIYNTFAVTVAQRTRESALLRAIGASRAQIMRSLTAESLVIGIISSVVGIGAGVALAAGLKALLDAIGFGLPAGGLTVSAGTIALSATVGIVVTVLASVLPAIRASRIPPLAALRDVSIDNSSASVTRKWLGAVIGGLGLIILVTMAFSSDALILQRAAVGAGMTFVGFLIFAPILARPVAIIMGTPLRWARGVAGGMAQRNAMRNPKRTANTAAALVVGVAVVTLFTIFASSIKTSIDSSVAGSFKGELVMSSNNFGGPGYSPKMTAQINELPEVSAAAALATGTVIANQKQLIVTVADPALLSQVLDVPARGTAIGQLTAKQLALSRDTAASNGWDVGSQVPVVFTDGTVVIMTVGSVYEGEEIVGKGIVPLATYSQHVKQVSSTTELIKLKDGVSVQQGQAAVQAVADSFGAGNVQTRDEFIKSASGQIDQLLSIVYVLLVLAIVIALMGITNTLSLSIHERTRELGLLRAVGQSRSQTRSMVRWESVIIALFGTLSGLVLGIVLGWALMKAVQSEQAVAEFSLPIGELVFVAIVGGLVGVIAGLRPAIRASRLNILAAINAE